MAASISLVLDVEAVGAELWQKVYAWGQISSGGRGNPSRWADALPAVFSSAYSRGTVRVLQELVVLDAEAEGVKLRYRVGACGRCLSYKQWGTKNADTWQK